MRTLNDHREIVRKILETELGESPSKIERMAIGLANEVYAASLPSRDVIVRLNTRETAMVGAERHIALFRSLGIRVPEIIASDYTKHLVPFAWQVQTRLAGRDLGDVIATLAPAQLKAIALEIARIVRALEPLPTNGKFGWSGGGTEAAFASWLDVLEKLRRDVVERTAKTLVVNARYLGAIDAILRRYRDDFLAVPSTFYYDDMCSKNVLVHDGKFSGLVDLDTVAYGDPMEGIGRIEASWHGTAHGRVYADAVMAELALDQRQRELVLAYAVLNRISWLSERGIKFNENTSTEIDRDGVARDEQVIDAMLAS